MIATQQPKPDDAPREGLAPVPEGAPVGGGRFLDSFRAAASGVLRTIASQRNMKLHMLSALMVLIVGMALPLDISARATLVFAVGIVLFAEILNTGLEALTDLFIRQYHRLAMVAKDAAAAGVLVLSLCAALVFADIIYTRWDLVLGHTDAVVRSVIFGGALVVSEAVGLFALRRGALSVLRLLASLGLVTPLVLHSTDPVFAGTAVFLLLVNAYARHAFPSGTGRGAPR